MTLSSSLTAFRQQLLVDVRQLIAEHIAKIRMPRRVVNVPFVLGAQGTALTTSDELFVRLGLQGQANIVSWSLAARKTGAPQSGAVTLDVQVGNTMGSVASICGTHKPALAAQSELVDQTPTGWTVGIADSQWMLVKPTAVDGVIEVVGLTLRLAVDPR